MIGRKQQHSHFLWSRFVSAIAIFWRVFLVIFRYKEKQPSPNQKREKFFQPSHKRLSPHKLFSPSFFREKNKRLFLISLSTLILTISFSGINLWFPQPAFAAATLRIEPLTFDHVGLDSNNVTVGPNQYLTGARVCNTGTETAQNVNIQFIREGAFNPYLTIQNTLNTDTWFIPSLPGGSLPNLHNQQPVKPANCFDAYYVATVARNAAAYNTVQKYRIEARADNASPASTNGAGYYYYDTAHPRQLYVEKILSQARNSVISFENLTTPGSFQVEVGKNYDFRLTAKTATAYPQLTISSDFPNIVFQIVAVKTTYSSDPGMTNSSVYADACGWLSDPNDSGYRASSSVCGGPVGNQDTTGDGKVGNTVVVNYTIKILESAGAGTYNVNHLILDFSGGSYHYNSDYGAGVGVTPIVVVERNANISIDKSHTGNFSIGTNSYNLLVTNNGPDTASAPIRISDTLPTGFTFNSVNNATSSSGWSCSANGQNVICENPNDLLNGNSSTLVLNVDVSNTAADNVVNTATVSSSTRDPVLSKNTDSDPTTIVKGANISLVKDDNVDDPTEETFVAGQTATYRLTVNNSSGVNVDGPLTIIDTLPNGLSYSSASGTNWSCSANAQNVTCTNANGLTNGSTSNLNLIVNVLSSVASQITNTATVTNGNTATQTNTTNNTKRFPDLIIAKTDGGQTFVNSSTGKYTITVTNDPSAGAAVTDTITVRDTLPTGLTYNSFEGTGWSCITNCTNGNSGPVTFATNTPLNIGDSTSFTITVNVASNANTSSPLTNTVKVDPNDTITETNEENNEATDQTNVIPLPNNPQQIDLYVTKTAVLDTSVTPPRVTYTIPVSRLNDGAGAGEAVVFTDIVPSELTNIVVNCTAVGTGSSCGSNNTVGNNVSYNLSIRKNQNPAVRLTITGNLVDTSSAQQFDNTASVTHTNGTLTELTPGNNSDTATVIFAAPTPNPDVAITKTAGPLALGSVGTYTLNVGNSNAAGTTVAVAPIIVTDTLPTGLAYLSGTGTGWICSASGQIVTCTNYSNIAPGTTLPALNINVLVGSQTALNITNTASVAQVPGENSSKLANNSTSLNSNVAPSADLSIVKSLSSSPLVPGETETYKLLVTNNGPSNVPSAVTVTDTLPNNLTFVSASGGEFSCSAAGQTVTCIDSDGLTIGESTTITLNVTVALTATGNTINPASVSSSVNDPNLNNNNSSTTDLIQAATVDLAVIKTHSGSFSVGGKGTYTIEVANVGNTTVTNTPLIITDNLPAALTFASFVGDTNWSCTGTNNVICNYTNSSGLTPGKSIFVDLIVNVGSNTPTGANSITNTVNLTAVTGESNLTNNSSNDPTTIQGSADLTVTKTDKDVNFTPGGTGTYDIVVTNNGASAADYPITIVDQLPTGLTYNSFTSTDTNWSCPNAVVGNVDIECVYSDGGSGSLVSSSPNNVLTTLTITVDVNASASGTVTNFVTVYSPTPDPNSDNNTDTEDTTIGNNSPLTPNVRLIKRITAVNSTNFTTFNNDPSDVNDEPSLNWPTGYLKGELIVNQNYTDSNDEVQYLEPGKEVEYTIYFLSDGANIAKNVTLCDLVPPNQTFVQDAFAGLPPATGGLDGTSRGIAAEISQSLKSYTNAEDGDAARFYSVGSTLPSVCTLNGGVDTGGAVVINLGDVPNATGKGTPINSYGFLRFRAKVN